MLFTMRQEMVGLNTRTDTQELHTGRPHTYIHNHLIGAQPWHHSSRLDDHFSPDPPGCRHRLNRAVGEHWRSGAYHLHLSPNARHRAHCTLPAPRRHSTQSQRRIPWAETVYRRPNTLSRHNTPWLDAHSRMALVGGWAMSSYWRHRALDRITRCLTSTALLPVSTGCWLRSIA